MPMLIVQIMKAVLNAHVKPDTQAMDVIVMVRYLSAVKTIFSVQFYSTISYFIQFKYSKNYQTQRKCSMFKTKSQYKTVKHLKTGCIEIEDVNFYQENKIV